MKTIIRRNADAKFGYEYVTIENGHEVVTELVKKTTDNYLYLPENDFNRKLIGIAFLDKQGDEWEVTPREPKVKAQATTATPRKGLEEYLEGDDRATYLALVEKAIANREKVKNDPVAKLKAKIEALKAQLATLEI